MTLGALAALVAIFTGSSLPARAAGPLEGEIAKNLAGGFTVKRKMSASLPEKIKLEVYVFEDSTGEFDRLRVWQVKGGKAHLVYLEMSSSSKIEFASVHAKGRLPDLYGDGSRTLAYTTSSSGDSQLRLVRLISRQAVPEKTPLPGGSLEDIDGDGRPEVIVRTLPLGKFFSVECGEFYSMAQGASRTTIYEFVKGNLAQASMRHARWFDQHIAALEGRLAGIDPRSSQRYGDYLGAAVSLYYDFAEKGLPRQGWSRFTELFRPSSSDPRAVAKCMHQFRTDLGRRLNIPEHWQ